MSNSRSARFPIGAAITVAQLETEPYAVLATLRAHEPVSWLPALDGWFVTRRDLAIEVMRDADRFTVDDDRFTTAAVLGPSMLSVDGPEHERHRLPFAAAFRPRAVREQLETMLDAEATRLVAALEPAAAAELRTALAGPIAVAAITEFLGLVDVGHNAILDWYSGIASAIRAMTTGEPVADHDAASIVELRRQVDHTLQHGSADSLLRQVREQGDLDPEELASGAAVLMFGAIETAEGMTANALWHVLSNPTVLARVQNDPATIGAVIEESLRLEPAAAFVDRYTVGETTLGGVVLPAGELVTASLLAANRDPAVFERPNEFVLDRPNVRQHVAFVQGPHACIGLHLARLETTCVLQAVVNGLPDIRLDASLSTPPSGLIFRKPFAVHARWTT